MRVLERLENPTWSAQTKPMLVTLTIAAVMKWVQYLSVDNSFLIYTLQDNHRPRFHGGVVVKVNFNQRYATTAVTHAILKTIADRTKIPLQVHKFKTLTHSFFLDISLSRKSWCVTTLLVGQPLVRYFLLSWGFKLSTLEVCNWLCTAFASLPTPAPYGNKPLSLRLDGIGPLGYPRLWLIV